MSNDPTSDQIRSFLMEKFPGARKRKLDGDTQLLESGILDSLGVLDVVGFLEERFAITVADEELTEEYFGSLDGLTSFVRRKRAEVEVAAE